MSEQHIVNLEEANYQGRPHLKNGVYTIRCLSCEKQTSRKQNPMLVFKWEFCAPESVQTPDGKTIKISGLTTTDWIVLNENGFPKLKSLHKVCQLPMTIDVKNPNVKQYVGKAVKAAVSTEPSVMKDDNTGEAVMDEHGQPITTNNYRIGRFNAPDLERTLSSDSVAF